MKHILLISFFVVGLFSAGYSQGSLSDRLALKRPASTKARIDIQVFPNPVTTHFSINENSHVQQIAVFNLIGRELKRYEYIESEQYYVGDLPKGIYLVQFYDRDHEILVTQRISKR